MTAFSYIGRVNSSAKLKKGAKFNIATYGVYLAPHKLSGHNTCPKASAECILGCLNTSGRVRMDKHNRILSARINRTNMFYSDRQGFMNQLDHEIRLAKNRAHRTGMKFAVRLNATSDLSPETFVLGGRNLLDIHSNIRFYDYTKVPNRLRLLDKYKNYHLTFSFSGHNWDECVDALRDGVSVAVVFDVKRGQPLPKTFRGYRVIDGDITDYRPSDPKGVIVGLRWKRIRNKLHNDTIRQSKFVIQNDESEKRADSSRAVAGTTTGHYQI
jgi:hypothetical protein